MKTLLYPMLALGLFMPGLSAERDAFDEVKFKQFIAWKGNAYYYFHLDDRRKRVGHNNHWIQFNGTCYGLMLQVGEGPKVSFPGGESWVVTPGRNRVPLLIKQRISFDAEIGPGRMSGEQIDVTNQPARAVP